MNNLGFIECDMQPIDCPLKPTVNKRSPFYWLSRFYRPFADDVILNKIEISLYNNYILKRKILNKSILFTYTTIPDTFSMFMSPFEWTQETFSELFDFLNGQIKCSF